MPPGLTWRWNCTLVQAASGMIVSTWASRRSGPSIAYPHVLAAGRDHLLVEQVVPGVADMAAR